MDRRFRLVEMVLEEVDEFGDLEQMSLHSLARATIWLLVGPKNPQVIEKWLDGRGARASEIVIAGTGGA